MSGIDDPRERDVGGEEPEELEDFTEVYSCNFSHQAEQIKAALQEEGIDCFIRRVEMTMLPTGIDTIRISVPMNMSEVAKRIIQDVIRELELSETDDPPAGSDATK